MKPQPTLGDIGSGAATTQQRHGRATAAALFTHIPMRGPHEDDVEWRPHGQQGVWAKPKWATEYMGDLPLPASAGAKLAGSKLTDATRKSNDEIGFFPGGNSKAFLAERPKAKPLIGDSAHWIGIDMRDNAGDEFPQKESDARLHAEARMHEQWMNNWMRPSSHSGSSDDGWVRVPAP